MTTEAIRYIPESDYHSDKGEGQPSLSSSICKILCSESPLHAWTQHPRLNPNFTRKEKEIFDLGTVAHALMLQGLKNAIVFDVPDWKTVAARDARAEARAEGKTAILRHHWNRVQDMVQAGKVQIAAHRECKDAFTDAGKAEQSLEWIDGHGVRCRARLDWLRNDHERIADYKGTGMSVNPESIARLAVGGGWDVQAAFYRRGLKKITGKDAEFVFVAQEDTPPYALTVVGMGPDFAWSGEGKVQRAIDKWAECLASNKWPAYPDRIVYPQLPIWEESRIVELESRSV